MCQAPSLIAPSLLMVRELPLVVRFHCRAWAGTIQPGERFGIAAQLSVPEGLGGCDSAQATATPVAAPTISSYSVLSNGSFSLSGTGTVGQPCVLLVATNLAAPVVWTPVATSTVNGNGTFALSETQATNNQRRFYRVRTP